MKRLLTILLLILASFSYAEKRALVIGIGEYPDVDYGWHAINGDNDIPLVVDMLQANGFSEKNITTLKNEQATFKGITTAIKNLIHKSGEGDVVYIHFSGHGQQITDLDGDEPDGFDESWVPYDALQEPTDYYHGERHITDDMLNTWLHQLRKKAGPSGKIVAVSDACHSGTSTRLANDETIRGSYAKFIIHAEAKPFSKEKSIDWISISACSDRECNRQVISEEGNPCGSLTYALYLLQKELSTLSVTQVLQKLSDKLQPPFVARPQTPKVECPDRQPSNTLF